MRIETLASVAADLLGARVEATTVTERPMAAHQTNRLFDVRIAGQHLIAKLFCHPDARRRAVSAEREHGALRLVRPLGLAPRPVAFRASEQPLLLYEYLPGTVWDREAPTSDRLAQLATVWLDLASLPTHGLWPAQGSDQPWPAVEALLRGRVQAYARWAAGGNPRHVAMADQCLSVAERLLAAVRPLADMPFVATFCHWDPRFANVLQSPDGRLRLLDWEDSGVQDLAADVGCLLTHPNQEDLLTPAQWSAFLRPLVGGMAGRDADLEHRSYLWQGGFWVFWLGALLQDGVQRAQDGQLPTWRINDMDPNVRLRRYLARALAWPDEDFSPHLRQLTDATFFDV